MSVFPLFYAGPIEYYKAIVNHNTPIVFEVHENFPKQTYRNRCYIAGANGLLKLIIPVQHSADRSYRKRKIANVEDWQAEQWKSLQSAYRSSPYFEYYEHDLKGFYNTPYVYLIDFNKELMEWILKTLSINISITYTKEYESSPIKDFKDKFDAKNLNVYTQEYTQVFQEKYSFIPNLSILDLLFNKGPEALSYLKQK